MAARGRQCGAQVYTGRIMFNEETEMDCCFGAHDLLGLSSDQNATNESCECAANMADFRHLWSELSVLIYPLDEWIQEVFFSQFILRIIIMMRKMVTNGPERNKSEVILVCIMGYFAEMIANIGKIIQGNWISSFFVIGLTASSIYLFLDRKPSGN
jgi:hypothetical protein